LNFKEKTIVLVFNEFVSIEKPNENVIITPPQIQMPIIKAVGKKITVELRDSLIDSTTYTIDFTNSIVDYNEKNALENFSFAFSTGDVLDTLQIGGIVINAKDMEPVQNMLVGIHRDLSDTAFTKTRFLRTSKTDDKGMFVIKNVSPGSYRIFALDDKNRNYAYDKGGNEGLAFLDSRPVTVIANQKGRSLKENMRRNHGMANPEGYRKALRLAKEAEKFRRPIITFVDTSGAYPGLGAEERGIGEAIARNLMYFSQMRTPIVCVIIGEGGSGGALGICVGDKIYMLENAIYSVISPEGCASILLRDSSRAKDSAAMLKITSADLMAFNVINGVIAEPRDGAHTDPDIVAASIKKILIKDIKDLTSRNPAVLVRYRNQKIRKIGHWNES